jgi:outer membrane protein assembly factor BamA
VSRRILPWWATPIFCLLAFAQKPSQADLSYKLTSIHVKGGNLLTEEEVIAASGLKLGQFVHESDFQQSIESLGDTGLFTNLTYSYHYSPTGCDLEFQISENNELVPIVFDNLVWFSDGELISLLHSKLPLFHGRLPRGGNLADEVADALSAVLTERKITGKVEYLSAGKADSPIDSYEYRIKLHPVLVRNIDFPGAQPDELPALATAAQPLSGADYLRSRISVQETFSFLPVYLARGYFKANLAPAEVKVVEDGSRTLVDLSFPVKAGEQYKLTRISWQGNTVFPAQKLGEFIHLKPGEPANSVELSEELEAVKRLYGSKGYLFARVDPTPTLDDAQATVAYELEVTEGDLYRMGDLLLDGLDADAAKRLAEQWQIKKGDPYDSSYLAKFFSVTYRDVGLRHSYDVVRRESVNQKDKTVSVALHFMPKG